MNKHAYIFQHMPKIIMSGSFDFEDDVMARIVDDPVLLRKCASSSVVHQWGDIGPKKNASLIHLIAMGAHETTGPNRNGDAWKRDFLKSAHPTFIEHGALYRDHKNKDYDKRDGDIIKTAFNDDMGRVELLVSADHDKCADWLPEIEKGNRVNYSMGFDCEHDVCSICDNVAPTRKEYCKHVKKLAKAPFGMGKILEDGRKCFVFNPKGVFNDISKVPVGADMIAQQLRKVAGLDEEIIGGAELADSMFPELSREKHASKIAVASKLSRMEKLVPFSAQRVDLENKIPEKTAAVLREMPVAKMFGELAKLGCLLPFRSFFDLIMGEKVAELEPHLSEGEKAAHRVFDFVMSSDAILGEVCSNGAFECAVPSISKLGIGESNLMSYEFGMEPSLAGDRMVKNAICASRTIELAEPGSVGIAAQELLKQYASYKIAALESGSFALSDDLFYVAAATF